MLALSEAVRGWSTPNAVFCVLHRLGLGLALTATAAASSRHSTSKSAAQNDH
jgi:hypothetical protein